MSESKHTPGPWTVEEHPCVLVAFEGTKHEFWIDPVYFMLSMLADASSLKIEAARANARLIAAAPDLLAALKKAHHELNTIRARDGVPYTHSGYKSSVCEDYFSSVVDECTTAISKAEGRA